MLALRLLMGAFLLAGSVFVCCVAVRRMRAGKSEFRAVALWAAVAPPIFLLALLPALVAMAPLTGRWVLIASGVLMVPWALYGVIRVIPLLGIRREE